MPINPIVNYQQALSMALEDRARGYEDLVSNSSPLFALLRSKGLMKSYSGPRIRQTLQIAKPDGQWYSGYDYLANPPIELFNDAYFTPKMVVVPISITMEEILNNEGSNQIMDVMESYMDVAERSLVDVMDVAVYGDGTANNGKQLGGLGVAVPIVTNVGTYGGIDRSAYPLWRTTTYDANSAFPTIGTQVNSTTIRQMLTEIFIRRSRGKQGADLLIMSPEHFRAYDSATVAIQRLASEKPGTLGRMGFPTLQYAGAGRTVEIVQEGGIGSNMPSNTTFGLDTSTMRLRFNKARNFDKLFPGDGLMPINQDAIGQFIGWMGELTQTNPLFNWRMYDSNPAA